MREPVKILELPYRIQKVIPELSDITFSVYWVDLMISVSEFVKYAEWGGNKVIRNGGIRVGNGGPVKEWDVIRDPHYNIKKTCEITMGKGKKLAYLWIQGEQNGC